MSESAVTNTLLAHVGPQDRARVIQNITENLCNLKPGDDNGYTLAGLLLQIRDKKSPSAASELAQIQHDSVRHCESLRPILSFICSTIHNFENDMLHLRSVVQFCDRNPEILDIIVTSCKAILTKFITVLAGDKTLAVSGALANGNDTTSLDESFGCINVGDCLSFMKALLRQIPTYKQKISPHWMIILAAIVKNGPQEYSSKSKDVILSFFSSPMVQVDQFERNELQDETERLKTNFWSRVLDLAEIETAHQEPHLVNIGLTIWLRLLSVTDSPWLPSNAFIDNDYWQKTQSILAHGSSEQRKLSLAILKRSVLLCAQDLDLPLLVFRESEADTYRSQYLRFTTLFETIVLARYLNQVQDCLPGLETLSNSTSLVQSSWIIVLIHASLSHEMQGSVRKATGSWALDHASVIVSRSGEAGVDFLQHAFLPWATLGSHFHCSVQNGSTGVPICPFGERLSKFLAEALHFANNDQIRSSILGASLRYLAVKGGRILSFARAFVLEGLLIGLRRHSNVRLKREDVFSLNQISQERGFQEIVRDLMILQCSEMYELAVPSSLRYEEHVSAMLGARKPILFRVQPDLEINTAAGEISFLQRSIDRFGVPERVYSMLYDESLLERHPTRQMTVWLKNSKQRCLSGNGLKAASDFLYNALESAADVELAADDLNYVLNAIWDEVQLRDYPRLITMSMPRIVFHPICVSHFPQNVELGTTVDKIARILWDMSRTRIYLFSPIAVALRRVFLDPRSEHLPFTDLIMEYANSPPSAGAEFELERMISSKLEAYVPGRNYEYYYGKAEAFGHACIFDTLNKLPAGKAWDICCRQILNKLIERWLRQRIPIPVFTYWKTTSQLQVLLILVERLAPTLSRSDADACLSSLFKIMSMEPLPRFRYLLEWTILRIYVHFPETQHEMLDALSRADVSNSKFTVSQIKIASMVAALPSTDEVFGLRLMAELVSLSANQKIVIRHEAHWAIPLLWNYAEKRNWKSLTGNVAFARLNQHIRSLETFQTPPAARILEKFNPVEDHNLTNLVQGKYLLIDPSEIAQLSRSDLVAVRQECYSQRSQCSQELLPLGSIEPDASTEERVQAKPTTALEKIPATMLQTKSSTWHDDVSFHEVQGTGVRDNRRDSNGIIVVASLIDSPYNLGGISRVSEVFGVESLQVQNLNVTKSKDFTSVSVSSHLWLPIEELRLDAIQGFLSRCRLDGYKVVGMEQTDSSRILGTGDCKLPWKMVLVLGSEREGIPADLLAEMDFCVEVRQTGVTRSMNVQTALSVGLFEYQRQHVQ